MRVFLLLSILIIFNGCITKRGTKVDAESIKPSELIRQPNGVYKLKPKEKTKIPDGIPYNPPKNNIEVKSIPVPPQSSISRPKPIEPKSAVPTETLPTAKASGELTPFSPTVKDASNMKVNVISTTNALPSELKVSHKTNTTIKTEEEMKVHWPELALFYLCCAAVLIIIYMTHKTLKKVKETKSKKKAPAKKTSRKKRKKSVGK